jgi:hypothetical protein
MLGLIRNITHSFYTPESLLILYLKLIKTELEYASIVRNSMSSIGAKKKKLKRIQRNFEALCKTRFFTHAQVKMIFLNLQSFTPCKAEDYLDTLLFISIYSGLKCRPPIWLLLTLQFFLVISETPSYLPPTVKSRLLLHVFRLPTLCAKTSISLGNPLLH